MHCQRVEKYSHTRRYYFAMLRCCEKFNFPLKIMLLINKFFNSKFIAVTKIIYSRGSYTEMQACGAAVCLYPRPSCCPGYIKQLDRVARTYNCVAQ